MGELAKQASRNGGETIEFLRRIALFSELTEAELLAAAAMFKEKSYKKNEIIFSEEDTGYYMYIILEGRVKVSRLLPNGKEMILAFHEKGEFFGEMSMIDGRTSPANVTAVVNTRILTTTHREFAFLMDNPKVSRALLRMLANRCRDAWGQIEVLTFHNADARIRTALYHLVQKKGVKTKNGMMIGLQLTHKELADITGISRETATRVLSNLQNENILSVETRKFVIPNPEQLVEDLLVE